MSTNPIIDQSMDDIDFAVRAREELEAVADEYDLSNRTVEALRSGDEDRIRAALRAESDDSAKPGNASERDSRAEPGSAPERDSRAEPASGPKR